MPTERSGVLPFITIAVLTKNAKKDIEVILPKIQNIDYPKIRLEIIVVDNGSTDGTKEMIGKKFKNIKTIVMDKNYGMSALNNAFKVAKGKYCMVFDDDSYLEPEGLKKIIKEFENDLSLGILACNIVNPYDNQSEYKYLPQTGDKTIDWCDFIGGGVAIKTEVFKKAGYFSPDILIYGHEADFSLRALNAGYKIKFAPFIKVYRVVVPNKINEIRIKLGMRNFLSIFWKYLSFPQAFSNTCAEVSEYLILSIMSGNISAYLKGLFLFIGNLPNTLRNRRQIKKSVEEEWKKNYPLTLPNFFRRMTKTYKVT